jgi:predicted nucleic acid-binding protein
MLRVGRRASMPPDFAPTSMPWSTSPSVDEQPARGLLDTSAVIDHDVIDPDTLPDESAIAAITLAELAAGAHATSDHRERASRADRLQWAATTWDPLPFDADAARAYGRVYAETRNAGRSTRSRLADLLIAATAVANGLPIYTRNPSDLAHLRSLVRIVAI